MGVLSIQEVLSSTVAQRRFLLRPAEPDFRNLLGNVQDSIYFGRSYALNVPVHWDYRALTNPHISVIGMSGSGKSYFIKQFISRAGALWGSNALILDWSGEYSDWAVSIGGKIIDFSRGVNFNILDCRPTGKNSAGTTPRVHIERILSALSTVFGLCEDIETLSYLKSALLNAYSSCGASPDSVATPHSKVPSLQDVLVHAKSSAHGARFSRAVFILESLCYKNSPFLPTRDGININSLTSSGTVSLNLSSLPSDAHRSLAALFILHFLKEKMRLLKESACAHPKCILVADEAWKIAQDENSDLVQILREGRKYSFALIIASQNPTDISKTILSNCATTLVFRLLHHEFRASLLESLNLPDAVSVKLERFPVGRALCRMALKSPGAYDGPFIISKIDGDIPNPHLSIRVGEMDVRIQKKELSRKLWGMGLTDSQISTLCSQFEQNGNSLGAKRLAVSLLSFGLSRSTVISFLRDAGVCDSSLLSVFSGLDAQRMGVPTGSLLNLVVRDD